MGGTNKQIGEALPDKSNIKVCIVSRFAFKQGSWTKQNKNLCGVSWCFCKDIVHCCTGQGNIKGEDNPIWLSTLSQIFAIDELIRGSWDGQLDSIWCQKVQQRGINVIEKWNQTNTLGMKALHSRRISSVLLLYNIYSYSLNFLAPNWIQLGWGQNSLWASQLSIDFSPIWGSFSGSTM